MRLSRFPALVALLALSACADGVSPDPEPTPLGTPRAAAQATRDSAALAGFVTNEGRLPVGFEPPPGGGTALVSPMGLERDIELELEASVAPPVVGGETLEATDVTFGTGTGTKLAYVAYSKRGAATLGAVDVIRVSDADDPKLVGRVTFTDTDIFAVEVAGGRLFLAGMTSDPAFSERAVLEVVQLDREGMLPQKYSSLRLPLPSFAGTAIHAQNNLVWVTSGTGGPNTGGVSVYDARSLQLVRRHVLDDARGVHGDSAAGVIVVTQGTPGRTTVYDHATAERLGAVVETGGATIPEARGDVVVSRGRAFVAASNGGTRVLSVDRTGARLLGNGIARPIVAGLDSTLSTVNGLALAGTSAASWIFTANGEAGVYAYYSNFPAIASSVVPAISLIGRLSFPRSVSANFIRVDREYEYMFVASGLGGLRIIEID